MNAILQDLPHALRYIDDILITRATEEHNRHYEKALRQFPKHGI
jgi:hypothetical protein